MGGAGDPTSAMLNYIFMCTLTYLISVLFLIPYTKVILLYFFYNGNVIWVCERYLSIDKY